MARAFGCYNLHFVESGDTKYYRLFPLSMCNERPSRATATPSVEKHAHPPTGFAVACSAVRHIWWQRWDDDNCQNGVALPM